MTQRDTATTAPTSLPRPATPMNGRRLLMLSHRYVGLLATLFLLIAGVTGCLLVFRDSLDAALNPDMFDTNPRPPLTALQLIATVGKAHPDWHIHGFALRTQAGHAMRLDVAPLPADPGFGIPQGAEQVFVDPADGHVTGARTGLPGLGRRDLCEAIYCLHYTLLAGTVGRWCMGLVALAWLALNLLGTAVTWPRLRPWFRRWSATWRVNGRSLKSRPLPELHRVCGLWLLLPLTVLACTSVAMNFYGEIFQPLVEALSPPRVSPFDRPQRPETAAPPTPPIGYASALQAATRAAASRTPTLLPVALADDADRGLVGISFAPGGTTLYEGFGRITYEIDRRDGRLVWVDDPRLDGVGRLLLRSLYPLHSGQVAGWPTRLLVLLLGLAVCGLAVTGFLPWWRRRRGTAARRSDRRRSNRMARSRQ